MTFVDFFGAAVFFVAMARILPSEVAKPWYLHAV
jgi:hypothetical protein